MNPNFDHFVFSPVYPDFRSGDEKNPLPILFFCNIKEKIVSTTIFHKEEARWPLGCNFGHALLRCNENSMKNEKIKKLKPLQAILRRLRARGKRIVFTNGCFDILHVGHIRYLRKAKKLGDILVIGLNTDRSVKKIKGDKRPVVAESERAEVLAALEFVDFVILFDESDPFRLIQLLKPQILVKGADWPKNRIIGRQAVEEYGGRVVRISLVPGASSTGIIERIIQVYGRQGKNS
jgi:rfaE bifunctional protein nucleotidyltransferase chain/domain